MAAQNLSPLALLDHQLAIGDKIHTIFRSQSINPTPCNYELLYSYHHGSDAEIIRLFNKHLEEGLPLTAAFLEEVYAACIANDERTDAISKGTDEIAAAGQQLVEQVAANQQPLVDYGATLADWGKRLTQETTVEDLLKAVATLSLETSRASERNRTLEKQLSASSSRIAKLRQTLVDVKQEATVDGLTGIANRKAFDAKLRRSVAQLRTDPSAPLCLLMLDIDHFKQFNDTHGHRTGDQVLRLVARMLSDNVKGKDTAARYGGEEFAILLAGADLQAGMIVARQICARIGGQRLIKRGTGEQIGQVTLSVGVAQYQIGEGIASLVERADAALYEAKRTGRNKVCLSN